MRLFWLSLVAQTVKKKSACNAEDLGLVPGLGRSPGDGNGKPIPVLLPGEFHGRGAWQGSPSDCRELDMTEQLTQGCFIIKSSSLIVLYV